MTVYRRRFTLLGMLAGCLFFIASLILDRLGLVPLGWFQHASAFSYLFLAFLTAITVWLTYLLSQANRPVISLGSTEATFSHFHRPDSSATIPYAQIQNVSTIGDADSVPSYLVLELQPFNSAETHSPIWEKTLGNKIYFECSNLTSLPDEIRANLEARISQRQAETQ